MLLHLVASHHAGQHVVTDVAVIEPDARGIGDHIGGDHLRRGNYEHISALPGNEHGVAVPVRRVRVVEIAEGGDVPAHMVAFLHGHQRHVAVDISIDGPLDVGEDKACVGDDSGHSRGRKCTKLTLVYSLWVGSVFADVVVEIPTFVLINGDEHGYELMVDIVGAAVRAGHAPAGDDETSDQAGGDVPQFVAMGMVEPEQRVGIAGTWGGSFGNLPDVLVGSSVSHAAILFVFARGVVVVVGALRVFLIEHAVGMHAERMGGIVLEDDVERVTFPVDSGQTTALRILRSVTHALNTKHAWDTGLRSRTAFKLAA